MKPVDIKNMMKKINVTPSSKMDQRTLADIVKAQEETKQRDSANLKPMVWKIIMKGRIARFVAAAVTIIAVISGVNIFNGTPVWAIDQTVKALESIQTLVITGTDSWGSESVPFKFWLRFPENKEESLHFRFESEKQIVVVKGTKAWSYRAEDNVVKIYDNVTTSNGMMRDLTFWYKIAENNPWITGKMLATLKLFTEDWQEDYCKFEKTGRDCVFVTCSYKPLSISFWFVCDLESKFIVEGKYWRNANRQGVPESHAVSFKYNEKIDDDIFNFTIPEGAKLISKKEEKEADALFAHGETLLGKKENNQAIKIFQEVYEKYPNLNIAESSLMMIGLFGLFIISRIVLCSNRDIEYKNLEVPITNDYIQSDGERYFLYIEGELKYLSIFSVDIIVNSNINTPYIENYYSRRIKYALPHSNYFFLYNRKEDVIGEWKDSNCGCGTNYKLIVDKEYEIKNIK